MNLASRLLTRAGIGLMKFLAPWPLPVVRALGTALGVLLHAVVRSRRRIVQTNLRLCFPQMPQAERLRLTRQTFVCFGQAWLDRSWLWHGSPELLRRRLHLHGALHELEGQDIEALVFKAGDNPAHQAALHAVGFQQDERPFHTIDSPA